MNKKTINPTDAELEILQVLWELGECKVKDIHNVLNQKKDVGYTTVLKIMQIMHEKGMLDRSQAGKSHLYIPLVKREEIEERFLDKVLNKVYNGSAYKLVMNALGTHKATNSELEKIKKLITEQQDKLK